MPGTHQSQRLSDLQWDADDHIHPPLQEDTGCQDGIGQPAAAKTAFNLGSGREQRVLDMAKLVNEITGNEAGIKYVERRDWDVKIRLLSSIGKAQRLLGYEPRTNFEEGIKKTLDWFIENWGDIEKSAEF